MKCSRCGAPVKALYDYGIVVWRAWRHRTSLLEDFADYRIVYEDICKKCYKELLRP